MGFERVKWLAAARFIIAAALGAWAVDVVFQPAVGSSCGGTWTSGGRGIWGRTFNDESVAVGDCAALDRWPGELHGDLRIEGHGAQVEFELDSQVDDLPGSLLLEVVE